MYIKLYFIFVLLQAVLNETSYGLHRLTQRQGLIKEFDILLPKSWNVPACQPGRQMTSVQRANPARPDFLVDSKAGRMSTRTAGPRPWTEQPEGCGKPGYGIHIPTKFLDLGESPFFRDSWELRTKGKKKKSYFHKIIFENFPANYNSLYPYMVIVNKIVFC
jgi:hypothetical protein